MRRFRIIPHQFKSKISLHRSGEVIGPAGIHIPAAIGLLDRAEIIRDQHEIGIIFLPQDEFQQDIFRFENRVALQLRTPISIGVPHADKGVFRARQRRFDRQRQIRARFHRQGRGSSLPIGGQVGKRGTQSRA